MSAGPAVSVVIVNHGRPAELAIVLKALEYQRYPDFELIVVTDLAPDARPASRLGPRWIHYEERNISAARNLGIGAARGDVVAFIDDDAVPEFGWLGELVAPFADPAIGASGGHVRGRNGVSFQWRTVFFDRCGRDVAENGPDDIMRIFAPDPIRCLKTVGTNCAFRRDALVGIGGFDAAIRFFLDEADVNVRLSRAGWSSAIVPAAQVLHGFAAGPYRTERRVPTDLSQIGASLAYFLGRHAAAEEREPRLREFRREQRRRLRRLFDLGLLAGGEMTRLMQGLEDGIAAGAGLEPALATLAPPDGTFVPAPRFASGRRLLFVLGGGKRDRVLAEAHAAAESGAEVTLLKPEISHRPLQVRFGAEGIFHHRFGVFGKGDRTETRPFGTRAARVDSERRRIAAMRGPWDDWN